jgi:multidrug efflux pump
MLTAAAAVLALIPISQSAFWGPLAYSMMGGILVATVLTIIVLPAAYALFFRVKRPAKAAAPARTEEPIELSEAFYAAPAE